MTTLNSISNNNVAQMIADAITKANVELKEVLDVTREVREAQDSIAYEAFRNEQTPIVVFNKNETPIIISRLSLFSL